MESSKKWYNLVGHDITVLPPTRGYAPSFELIGNGFTNLSPITNFLLNTWTFAIGHNKNLILTFPSNSLNTIPLLSYIYSKISNKSTLIFSSGNYNNKKDLIKKHNQNYQLLSIGGTRYLFKDVPICFINKDNLLDVQIFLPRAQTNYDKIKLKDNLISSNKPKILLNKGENLTRISRTLEKLSIDDEEFDYNFNLDIGCIIFENADNYISTKEKAKIFLTWLKENINENVLLFFHFSDSNLKFIPFFKKAIDSLIIPFDQNVLRNNIVLSKQSINYFENQNFSRVLNNYNLDDKNTYNFNFDINILNPLLDKGNLDTSLYKCQSALNSINYDNLTNKKFIPRFINLMFNLNNLTINPYDLLFEIKKDHRMSTINISTFISMFSKSLKFENTHNKYYLNKLLNAFLDFYSELSDCKPYGIKDSFDRVAKDYKILEIIHNKDEYFDNTYSLLVGTYYKTEVKILERSLKDVKDVEVIYLGNLFKKDLDFSKYNLLLPGILPPHYFSILKILFKKVLILSYEGNNYKFIKNQVDLIMNPSISNEKISMDYFAELYNFLGETTNNDLFNNFKYRYDEFLNNFKEEKSFKSPHTENEQGDEKSLTIRDIFNFNGSYSRYVKSRKKADSYLMESFSSSDNSILSNSETIFIELINIEDGVSYNKKLLKNKKYLRFKSYDKLDEALEVKPSMLNKKDYVIILEDNRSFLDLYLDIFDEKDDIKRDFVDYWKDLLSDYIEIKNFSVKEFYNYYHDFCIKSNQRARSYQTILNWVRGYTISPKDSEDLRILAELFEDDYILDNYKKMDEEAVRLRNFNIRMGRKLSTLIKTIILNSDSIDYASLSYEERAIYNKIRNSIYRVI